MENWQVILIVLFSVFVGGCIPVLVMAGVTLMSLRRQTAALGKKADEVLDDVQVIARRIRSFTRGIEGEENTLREVVSSLGGLSAVLKHQKPVDWTNLVVSVLLPAAVAFFRTLSDYPPSREGVCAEEVQGCEKSEGDCVADKKNIRPETGE